MALSPDYHIREYEKFVADGSGNTAVRTQLTVQDIHIGQVEIKDGATDTFAKVKSDGVDNALVVTQNSQPLPTGAATEATLATIAGDTTSIDGKIVACDTTGKATEAKQDSTITAVGNVETNQTDGSQKTQVVDGSGNVVTSTDAGGGKRALDVNVASGITLSVDLELANDEVCVGGTSDGGTTRQLMHTDVDGDVQVDILSSALPTGASTEATLSAAEVHLGNIDGKDFATSAKQDTGNTSLGTIAGAVSGSEMQVDVVSSALPTGAATEAKQDTGNTSLSSIDGKITACNTGAVVISSGSVTETNSAAIKTAVELIDNAISGSEMQVDIVDEGSLLKEATTSAIYNVTLTLASTEYSQALPANCKKFTLKCRTAYDVKLAYTVGESGTNYITIPASSSYSEDGLNLASATLYMQSGQAGVIVEIVAWS